MAKFKMVCSDCGSTEVNLHNAYVSWSINLQEWRASHPEDCEAYCETCGDDCEIKRVEIKESPKPNTIAVPSTLDECRPDQVEAWWAAYVSARGG